MKTLIKSLIASALILGASITGVKATVFTTNWTAQAAALTNSISTNGAYVTSITVTCGSGIGTTINLYDAATATNQYVLAAYTNITSIKTNLTSIITNSAGYLQTNLYAGIYSNTNVVSASTNTYPIAYSVTLPASSTVTVPVSLLLSRGIAYTLSANTTNTTFAVTYQTWP